MTTTSPSSQQQHRSTSPRSDVSMMQDATSSSDGDSNANAKSEMASSSRSRPKLLSQVSTAESSSTSASTTTTTTTTTTGTSSSSSSSSSTAKSAAASRRTGGLGYSGASSSSVSSSSELSSSIGNPYAGGGTSSQKRLKTVHGRIPTSCSNSSTSADAIAAATLANLSDGSAGSTSSETSQDKKRRRDLRLNMQEAMEQRQQQQERHSESRDASSDNIELPTHGSASSNNNNNNVKKVSPAKTTTKAKRKRGRGGTKKRGRKATKRRRKSSGNNEDDNDNDSASSMPPPKPKRPMTAYNFFFQKERRRILAMGIEAWDVMMDNIKAGGDVPHDGSDAADTTNSAPPRHKVTFEEMGKAIGRRWKTISTDDPASYARFQELAKEESARYKREIRAYNEKEEKKRRGREQNHQQDSADAINTTSNAASAAAELPIPLQAIGDQVALPQDQLTMLLNNAAQIQMLTQTLMQHQQQQPLQGSNAANPVLNVPGSVTRHVIQVPSGTVPAGPTVITATAQEYQIMSAQSAQIQQLQEQVQLLQAQTGSTIGANNAETNNNTNTLSASTLGDFGGSNTMHRVSSLASSTMNAATVGNGLGVNPSNNNANSSHHSSTSDSASSPNNLDQAMLDNLQAQMQLLQAQKNIAASLQQQQPQRQQQPQQQQDFRSGLNFLQGSTVNVPNALNGMSMNLGGINLNNNQGTANAVSTRSLSQVLRETTSSLSSNSGDCNSDNMSNCSSRSSSSGDKFQQMLLQAQFSGLGGGSQHGTAPMLMPPAPTATGDLTLNQIAAGWAAPARSVTFPTEQVQQQQQFQWN